MMDLMCLYKINVHVHSLGTQILTNVPNEKGVDGGRG